MPIPRKPAFAMLVALSAQLALAQAAKPCTATEADKPAVAAVLRATYSAAGAEDLAAFDVLLAPGFYAFDGGRRFDGDSVMKLIIDLHAKGFKYEWSVPDPVVELDCNTAWVAYENKGSVTTPDGAKRDQAWLESAFLVKRDGRWLLRFFHSTRAQ